MSVLFTLLFLFGFIFYCLWMAKPNLFKTRKALTRKNISMVCVPVLVVLFVLMGMNSPHEALKSDVKAEESVKPVAYIIDSDENTPSIVRKVNVELPERVSKQQLEMIANEIKNADKNPYERTLIMYRIKDEKSIAAWATTHFDPDLKVHFIGLDADQYKALLKMDRTVDGEKIGEWYATGGIEHVVVIYKKGGQYYETNYFIDDSAAPVAKKLKYEKGQFSYPDTDENWYFNVNDAGDLEYWGESGNSTTAKKIN